jgi:hypothetical protein
MSKVKAVLTQAGAAIAFMGKGSDLGRDGQRWQLVDLSGPKCPALLLTREYRQPCQASTR